MAESKGVVRVSVRGAGKAGRELSRAARELDANLQEELRKLEPEILGVYRGNALGGPSSRLARGLVVRRQHRVDRPGFVVESTARHQGYDYLGVTRFGHRRKIIRPSEDRYRATTISTGAPRGPEAQFKGQERSQTALALYNRSGDRIFRHYVRGYKPATDWVAVSRRQIDPVMARSAERLGRKITASIR